jgi:hypothetical protein
MWVFPSFQGLYLKECNAPVHGKPEQVIKRSPVVYLQIEPIYSGAGNPVSKPQKQ